MPPSGWFWCVVAIGLVGCTVPDGRPPLARIEITPAAIPEDDNFETVVTLDGTLSADPVDDPDGSEPLEFRWKIIGDEFELEGDSRDTDPAPELRFRGDRPATIELTVVDADGLDASATAYVQLTVTAR
jgi:hypothetical protein